MTQTTMPFMEPLELPDDEDVRVLWNTLGGRAGISCASLVRILNETAPVGSGVWDPQGKRIRDAIHSANGLIISGPGGGGYSRVTEIGKSKAFERLHARRAQAVRMFVDTRKMKKAVEIWAMDDANAEGQPSAERR